MATAWKGDGDELMKSIRPLESSIDRDVLAEVILKILSEGESVLSYKKDTSIPDFQHCKDAKQPILIGL